MDNERTKYRQIQRKPMQGKIRDLELQTDSDGQIEFCDITLADGDSFRLFPPFSLRMSREQWENTQIANGRKLGEVMISKTIRFLFYETTNGNQKIAYKDLKVMELVDDSPIDESGK